MLHPPQNGRVRYGYAPFAHHGDLVASITDGTNTRHFTYSANGNVATDDRAMDGGVSKAGEVV